MKKCAIALATLCFATFAFAASGLEDTRRACSQPSGHDEIMAAPDKGIPEEVLNAPNVLPWCQAWRKADSSSAENMAAEL